MIPGEIAAQLGLDPGWLAAQLGLDPGWLGDVFHDEAAVAADQLAQAIRDGSDYADTLYMLGQVANLARLADEFQRAESEREVGGSDTEALNDRRQPNDQGPVAAAESERSEADTWPGERP